MADVGLYSVCPHLWWRPGKLCGGGKETWLELLSTFWDGIADWPPPIKQGVWSPPDDSYHAARIAHLVSIRLYDTACQAGCGGWHQQEP